MTPHSEILIQIKSSCEVDPGIKMAADLHLTDNEVMLIVFLAVVVCLFVFILR